MGRKLRDKSSSILSTGSTSSPERSFEEVFISSFEYLGMDYKGMLYCFCQDSFNLLEHQECISTKLEDIS